MAGVSLQCGDCGTLLRSVEEAQEHAELTKHSNFSESTEAVLNLESELHTKRTGHTEFTDKTLEAVKPISLEVPKGDVDMEEADGASSSNQSEEMVVPEVDQKLLEELEGMGFPKAKATRALHFSGNVSLEAAVNWAVEHEDDADIEEMPKTEGQACGRKKQKLRTRWRIERLRDSWAFLRDSTMQGQLLSILELFTQGRSTSSFYKVPVNRKTVAPSLSPEEVKIKAQELRERARKKKEEEDKRMEREREKERIRVSKELLEAKRIEEENERKRLLAFRKAEKEEERRAREKIRQKLEEDKVGEGRRKEVILTCLEDSLHPASFSYAEAERRRKLGLPPVDPDSAKPSTPVVEEKKSSLPVRPATKADQMRDCLRSLKQNHKDDEAKVKTAFNTLLTYVKNAAANPNEEKFRKIRLTNATFQLANVVNYVPVSTKANLICFGSLILAPVSELYGSVPGARVGALKGGIEFLELCGFEKVEGGEFLFLPRDKVDMAVLSSAGTELNSAINNPFFGVL
ncbi:hypothetical protein RHMOL_Rhmol02G0067000 [Rhododendron molle]|uniref:Uncharacterized protein n=1 Tax=Rhododendron molle TaxID=49168 RepID=A0ACC0PNM6_RHOML|nr:hypothetical protein RHMOL_Rhmol02G0067000 [Rhododendron molle]